MQYRLRSLLILLALAPPPLALVIMLEDWALAGAIPLYAVAVVLAKRLWIGDNATTGGTGLGAARSMHS